MESCPRQFVRPLTGLAAENAWCDTHGAFLGTGGVAGRPPSLVGDARPLASRLHLHKNGKGLRHLCQGGSGAPPRGPWSHIGEFEMNPWTSAWAVLQAVTRLGFRFQNALQNALDGGKSGWFCYGVLAAIALAVGCARTGQQTQEASVRAVVSIQPQVWLVRQIGGKHVEVQALVQPGDSPATYQPTDEQISRVMASDVYFRIGVPFERAAWSEAIQATKKLRVVNTREGVPPRRMEEPVGHTGQERDQQHEHAGDEHDHQHNHAGDDPHVWLSPPLLKIQAETIASRLQDLDPDHADVYQRNLEALKTRLDEVDASIRRKLAPFAGQAFLIFHPAWGYFADEYGLRQVAIESQGKEPTDREMTVLQTLAREEDINVVFVQPQIPGKSAEAIAEAIGGRVETLDPVAEDVLAEIRRAAEAIAKSYQPVDSRPENHKASP
ncbi:MAG: zinc ABC transporter substrate-binding protein [Pirellulaceae bacterium]